MDLIGNSAVTIRDYGTIVHTRKLILELMQRGFLTNRPPWWLALYGYLRLFTVVEWRREEGGEGLQSRPTSPAPITQAVFFFGASLLNTQQSLDFG